MNKNTVCESFKVANHCSVTALKQQTGSSVEHNPGCNKEPVSSEISDLCEISDLLLFVSYFHSKGIKFGVSFFDVCYVNKIFLVRCQIPTSYSTGITITAEKCLTCS